ncbi:uncharacterized protein LOC128208888 [Mya arenaria]|uniref:uncharacterized protein LOC128208888 n=1 Tax=Mya arenaria TaxID=6604 RepID=UPI0022E08BB5|nr:uncharacterized protein LOC128208888 [Mya arenaria]
MIKYLLVANTGAAVLIARFYEHVPRASQQELQEAVVRLCLARSDKQSTIVDYEDYTVVYKKFSSVVFIAGITKDENELAIIELFRHIGETLIKYFGNLTELHFVYNYEKVYMILDEVISGGYIAETCTPRVLAPLQLTAAASHRK